MTRSTAPAPAPAGSAGSPAQPPRAHVVVVGGGIAGLAAAHQLHALAGDAVRVTVLEGAAAIGGKLRRSELAGVMVDEGAEATLTTRPDAVDLIEAVGLDDRLVHPGAQGASLWLRDGLHPLPARTVMGVPADLEALAAAGVLSLPALLRVPADRVLPRTPLDGDVAIGRYVAARLGREVVDRLVEPLLGGVYAGHADELSFAATMPPLFAAARTERSLLAAAERVAARPAPRPAQGENPPAPAPRRPVFASLAGGMGQLPEAVAAASGAEVRTRAMVRELHRTRTGWRLVVGSTRDAEVIEADAVILAVPAGPAARLLSPDVPAAAAALSGLGYASVGLVTFAFPAPAVRHLAAGTGFLVPPVDARVIKAATYLSDKWPWLTGQAPDLAFVRVSVGRYGEEYDLQRDDDELAEAALGDLQAAVGIEGAPVAQRVTRWGGALPQYGVGHLDRVARVRDAVGRARGLAVAGAAYDGVGVPACVASGRRAAGEVLSALRLGPADPAGGGR